MTEEHPGQSVPVKAGRREWLGLTALALPCLLISMDSTVLYLAVPQLTEELRPSSTQLLWILDIYGFLVAGFLITMGTLGDRIGRRRLLMAGATAFGLASLVAAWASSAELLIAARALLGVAGATLMPSTLALIRNMFHDPAQRASAIAVWMTSFVVGMAIGPLVGGALLEHFWWGSAFLIAVPVMVLLLVVGPFLLPEYRAADVGRIDPLSVVLSVAALLLAIYGIKELAVHGPSGTALATTAAGIVLGTAFVVRQRRLTDPLLDVGLFANRRFSASLGTLTLTLFAMSGMFLFLAQYLQLALGLSPLSAGLWTLPEAFAMIAAGFLTPVLARRFRPAYVMAGGLVIAACGCAMYLFLDGTGGLAILVTATVVFALGMGPMTILGTDMILSAVPPERAGGASAMSETNQEFGMAIGVAGLGSVGTALYSSRLAETMPAGVPAETAEAAGETLAAALSAAAALPGETGEQLAAAARAAFSHGLHVNAVLSSSLVLCAAVLVAVLLRHVQPPAGDEGTSAGVPRDAGKEVSDRA
ncbi:MFS transporter [Streptomyces sp. NPDC088729]|uniref:MFS transporter n=1 Tax=Streptomyces sp. NPDC088729 TaxID=3365876 RepID=UPI00381E9E02